MPDDEFDKKYLRLGIPSTDLQVQVKLDDEGVVIDVLEAGNDDPVASTWKLYDEFGVEVRMRIIKGEKKAKLARLDELRTLAKDHTISESEVGEILEICDFLTEMAIQKQFALKNLIAKVSEVDHE